MNSHTLKATAQEKKKVSIMSVAKDLLLLCLGLIGLLLLSVVLLFR